MPTRRSQNHDISILYHVINIYSFLDKFLVARNIRTSTFWPYPKSPMKNATTKKCFGIIGKAPMNMVFPLVMASDVGTTKRQLVLWTSSFANFYSLTNYLIRWINSQFQCEPKFTLVLGNRDLIHPNTCVNPRNWHTTLNLLFDEFFELAFFQK